MRQLILGLSLALATTAAAQAQPQPQPQPRSVEYFITHNADRMQMEKICARGFYLECPNVQAAEHYMLLAENQKQANRGRLGAGSVDSPLYFNANPVAREMTLRECVHPTSWIRPDAVECQAARISAGQK